MNQALEMLKIDLGINHDKRDAYFNNLLQASKNELQSRGVYLDLLDVEDLMLLCDYSAWNYRKRQENIPISRNLQQRIRNRQTKARANNV